jgi:hypothetical protein
LAEQHTIRELRDYILIVEGFDVLFDAGLVSAKEMSQIHYLLELYLG